MHIKKQRGRKLEIFFERLLARVNLLSSLNIIAIRLEIKRIGGKIFRATQPCDFVIDTGATVWYLDAKECVDTRWYPSKAPAHQRECFQKAQAMGRRAGFVVWFYASDPAMVNLRFIDKFTAPVTIEDGIKFDWQMLLERNC